MNRHRNVAVSKYDKQHTRLTKGKTKLLMCAQ